MEVLAAIGLAGNIIQFVDFGGKLISKTTEIQKSSTGALAENINIETATNDLALLSTKLHDSAKSADDTALRELCHSCDTVATELLTVLDTIKLHGKQHKWKSFRKALRSVWSKDDIALLEQRLSRFRDKLNLRVTVDLRERVIQINEEQSSHLNTLDLNTKNLVNAIVRQKDVFEKAHTILQRQYLEKLVVAAAAPFNSYNRCKDSDCIQNTRVDLLQEIREWADGNDKRPIFWLRGLAGTGKSTVARTIAHHYYDRRRLAASFFFSRDIGGDVRDARKFFTTIAAQLARASDRLGDHICNAINQNSDIVNQAPRDQWRKLILEPLLKLQCSAPQLSLVLIVDALDECENKDDIRIIVNLLPEARLLRTVRLRILITSRPEIPIRQGFDEIPNTEHHDFVLHDISRSIVDHDIRVFIEYHFAAIRQQRRFNLEWPGGEIVGALVEHASGLFIWAATACRFIKDGGRFTEKRLSAILGGDISTTAPEKGLDVIYLKVLQSSIHVDFDEHETSEHCSTLREVLGAIITLFASLSIGSLARLVNITAKDIDESLGDLHAIMDIRKDRHLPIRLHHPSFRDFLLNKKRCDDPRFWVNKSNAHELLTNNCIDLLSAELRRDICDLQEPGAIAKDVSHQKVDKFLSTALQYACQNWVQHLKGSDAQLEDNGKTHNFLRQHLLHWFEALSLLGKISEAVLSIQVLEDIIDASKSPNLYAIIHDSKRFILYNRSIIEEAPLQTYYSALMFTPQKSLIRKQFEKEMPNWIKRSSEHVEEWSSLLQTLEGHTDAITAVAFSPNGKVVASASFDGTVRLWDSSTGSLLHTLRGPTLFSLVAFSPDGKLAVSGSNGDVWLWDSVTGTLLGGLKGHSSWVNAVTFSPDGKLLASASKDETIRLWDPATRTLLQTLKGHTDAITAVAFSPDGKLMASASHDWTIRLWNPVTGALIQKLKGHSSWVGAVAFSPNGEVIASASGDTTVKLWNSATGALVQTLDGHSSWVKVVTFSPDGKLVASASGDKTVRIWTSATGALLYTLEGHMDSVEAVKFSPDGKLVVSASNDWTVRLWSLATGASLQTLEGHSATVEAVAFSPDGKLVASASSDRTVRLWEPATAIALQTLRRQSNWVMAVAFSPDGKLLASVSDDETVRLWDSATGALLQTFERHVKCFWVVAFSPDAQLIASAAPNEVVRLWDSATGGLLQTFDGHLERVNAVTFSPDSKLLASASSDRTVRLWDPVTGAPLRTLAGHSDAVEAIVFSPDGKVVASASFDGTVRLWDSSAGSLLHMLKGPSSWLDTVTFSPDGNLVASGSIDDEVWLWDSDTGTLLGILEGGSTWINAVAFSPDGKLVASASGDKTVRLWDVNTRTLLQTLKPHSGWFCTVAFSLDGKLVSASEDGTVRLWDWAKGVPLQAFAADVVFKTLSTSNNCLFQTTETEPVNTRSVVAMASSSQSGQLHTISAKDHWVVKGEENILWLPPNYRPTCQTIRGNVLVLGHASGHLTILELDVN